MKKFLALALAVLMLLAMAACGGKTDTPTPTQSQQNTDVKDQLENQENTKDITDAGKADNTAYVREQINVAADVVTSLTPWGTRNSTPGNYEVYEMLFECDSKGEMYALLADASKGEFGGYDHEKGTGVYTVYIYDYITDHNGKPVKASDVAYSYMYQLNNEEVSGWGDLQNVEAKDDTTVVFTFAKEQNGLGQLMNVFARCFIVSEESHKASASGLANEMCGTGPYKFESYNSGSQLTIVKNEDYWQKDELRRQESQANVNKIVYEFISESAQKVIALKTGKVDLVENLDSTSALDFADGGEFEKDFNVYAFQAKFVNYLNCNNSPESVCSDYNLRMAIYNAVDVDGLINAMGGTETKLPAYVSSYYSDYDFVDWAAMDNYNTKTGVNADLVKEYLGKSSYNGETLRLLISGKSDPATIIAAQLQAYGINVEVSALDFSSINATSADPTAWDLMVGMMAGDYNVTVWQHGFSFANNGDGDHTSNFVYDKEWDDLLNLCCTEEGHTPENLQRWWQIAVDNAYTMGLYSGNNYVVMPEDMTYFCQGDKLTMLPGACTYAAP